MQSAPVLDSRVVQRPHNLCVNPEFAGDTPATTARYELETDSRLANYSHPTQSTADTDATTVLCCFLHDWNSVASQQTRRHPHDFSFYLGNPYSRFLGSWFYL